MKNDNLLTEGNIFHVPPVSSVPFLVTNVIQALHGAVDLMVIGWYCTPASAAVVSTGTQVAQIITSMVSGLTLGGTVLMGKYASMKDGERTCYITGTTLSVLTVVALVLTAGMLVFRDATLAALKTPVTSMNEAGQYVTICFCGILSIYGYNAISAILWGYDDFRRPMYLVAMSCVLNIAGGTIFVKYLGLDTIGTALVTVLSQSISTIHSIVYLNRKRFIFIFILKNLRIDRGRLKELAMVGVPTPSQECMVRLSFFYLTSVTNRSGVNAVAAVGIANKYDALAILPVISIASVLAAITAQNYDVGEPERTRRSLTAGIGFTVLTPSVFFLWAQLSPQTMIGLSNINPDVIEAGVPFLHSYSFDYLVVSFAFCPNGFMNGRFKTVFTMVSCCFGALALRMSLVWLAYTYCPDDLSVIGLIAPAMSGFMAVYTMPFVIRQLRQDNSGRRKEFTFRSV